MCNWDKLKEREVFVVLNALRALQPAPAAEPFSVGSPRVGEPGVLKELAREVGLRPLSTATVDVPHELPDRSTPERAFLMGAHFLNLIEQRARRSCEERSSRLPSPSLRPDGSYRMGTSSGT